MPRSSSVSFMGVACMLVTSWCSAKEPDAGRPETMTRARLEQIRNQLELKRQPWSSISWRATITDARLAAAREQKPIFLMVNTGACVGFV